MRPKIVLLVLVAAGLIVAGVMLRRPAPKPVQPPAVSVAAAKPPPSPAVARPPAPEPVAAKTQVAPPREPVVSEPQKVKMPMQAFVPTPPEAAPPPATPPIENKFTGQVKNILESGQPLNAKSAQLAYWLKGLSSEDCELASDAVADAVKDDSFAVLKPLLLDPQLPEVARETFSLNLMDRPSAIRLPALLEMAQASNHPDSAEARDMLGIYLDRDLGNKWAAWQQAVEIELQKPDRRRAGEQQQ